MKTKIQIKSFQGDLLFEHEQENNSIKDTLLMAIKVGAYLSGANLYGANLYGADLYEADLSRADLSRANLSGADLSGANLYGANLYGADLSRADLSRAYLSGADLSGANLYRANLYGADLSRADLSRAYLSGANLSEADLSRADLSGADLYGAKIDNELIKKSYWIIPEQGSFEAWKKLDNNCIAKIRIPANAKRTCNLKNRKCRAEYVKTLAIWDKEGKRISEGINGTFNLKKIKYIVGKITKADEYDDSIIVDCTHGIHFFLTRQEAEEW